MNLQAFLALIAAIVFELIGISCLQSSEQFTIPLQSIAMVVTQALALYLLSIALKTIPIGMAYAMWCGLGITLVTGVSFVVFQQKMDVPALLGISLIAIGSVLIMGFSQSSLN